MLKRIKRIIPDLPLEYEAYVYIWRIWIEETNSWKYYGGRKHTQYHKTDYLHSSDNKQFKEDFARRNRIEFEILQYGSNEEMAYAEAQLLKTADNGIGAAKSKKWYNEKNAGGLYGKGSSSSVDLDGLWNIIKPLLKTHGEILINTAVNGILKQFIPEEQLVNIINQIQFLQTRDELFISDHVDTLAFKFNQDANPDSWEPIIILQDAKIVDNEIVYEKDSIAIISGNHRSRGNIKATAGIGLNAFIIPQKLWKGLKGVDFVTLSNRCNPMPDKPSLSNSPESTATWIIRYCKEKGLIKASANGKILDEPYFDHPMVVTELKEHKGASTKQVNQAITIARKRFENELLQTHGQNLIDFSDDGLKNNEPLKKKYLEKVAAYTSGEDAYQWVYKISADIFKIGKIIEEIRRKNYAKKGLVLVYFKTTDQRQGDKYKNYKKTFDADLENLFSKEYDITIKELPLLSGEAKAEGFID